MAGIYIHIPFCKQACHYCNFHFSTSLKQKDILLEAIHKELKVRKEELAGQTVETVYWGGGTPSLLSAAEISEMWDVITKNYTLKDDLELTLEANPDDLTPAYLNALIKTPINRFSIGIQSFFDEDLAFMNRAHNASHAYTCIQAAQDAGFDNLTIDLIYGTPTTSHERWKANLNKAFELSIPHISCYALTVEPKTALAHFVKTGKAANIDDDHTAEQFEILLSEMERNGYEQYEISNFCLPNKYAKHNSNYWTGKHYLGIGPAAHSFNGRTRRWNIANNAQYINALKNDTTYWETEVLTAENQFNEYIMTALRTKWGVSARHLEGWGGNTRTWFEKEAMIFVRQGLMTKRGEVYTLTAKGKIVSDSIIADLFLD
ncbi:radical SAM family heme chaperone HemW [Aureispira sp. CCB-E]|uniref:radical SAM family heme chaperone HemW n=1 Tax=Aureispira sp. CCB-E TaxID=3051121 RepID=UPI0028685BED|nr:radical SAM family heme chaperone HemW [Aureispira sp. CCB-E]WMX15998.1 radical SAM family heme chaperone HemW [Aureispira sp. CCB-E]